MQFDTILLIHDTEHNIAILELQLVYIFLSELQVLPHYRLHLLPLFVLFNLIGDSLALPLYLFFLLYHCLHRIINKHARQLVLICETSLCRCNFLSFGLLELVLDENWGCSRQHLLRGLWGANWCEADFANIGHAAFRWQQHWGICSSKLRILYWLNDLDWWHSSSIYSSVLLNLG